MTTDIAYLSIGLVAGILAGALLVYFISYRSLQGANRQLQADLNDVMAKSSGLQGAMLEEQTKSYQTRRTLLSQQKQLETDLAESRTRYAELEQQRRILQQMQGMQGMPGGPHGGPHGAPPAGEAPQR